MAQNRKKFLQTIAAGLGMSFLGVRQISAKNTVQKSVTKPKALKKGDTIGMISPGFSLPHERQYGKIVKKFERFGFKVKVGAHARDHYGYFAGTDKNRASDLNNMFADTSVDAIIPFRGGWGSDRILPYIDFDLIRHHPKILLGFSDITALLLSIYARSGLVTFHGPLGEWELTPFNRKYFKKALMDARPFVMKNRGSNKNNNAVKTLRKGTATGTLLGGNLTVLTSMLGSDYLPDWENGILFLEDVGEDIYRIDRMLTQLQLNGVFEKINGFVFGKCSDCKMSKGRHFTLNQVLSQHLKKYDIPAYSGANIGHIKNIFTLPIGVKAQMDAGQGIIKVLESPVKQAG